MKILYVTHTTDLAGANRSMLQLIKELRRKYSIEPFVVFPKIEKSLKYSIRDVCQMENIPFLEHRLTNFKKKKPISFLKKLYYMIFNFIYVCHIYFLLRKKSFDLIHSNSSVNDTGAYLSILLRCPHIWHLREYGDLDFGLYPLLGRGYEKIVYTYADEFIAISKSIKMHFEKVISPAKISLVYNGIKPQSANFYSSHNSDILQLCIVGRVEENKNQLEALKALAMLKKENMSSFHLTIVGAENIDYKKNLLAFIEQNELEDYVEFLGTRSDVPDILKRMDVGLMLSTSEAFGRVTVEYMLQNLAVVATKAGANEELIENGKTGYLYTLGNVSELESILRMLINDRIVLCKISQKGQEYALKNFVSEINSSKIYDIYKRLSLLG